MTPTLRAPVLVPGVATGIGSLPHDDPTTAAELVLRCLPELPAVPQLPGRDPREGMIAQWLVALPEVEVAPRRLAHGARRVRRRAGVRLRRPGALGSARVPRRRVARRARRRHGSRCRSPVRSRSVSRCTPPGCRRRARSERAAARHACVVGRARGARRRAAARHRTGALPRRAGARGVASRRRAARSRVRRSTCCRARSPRSTASPACTCAATATSRSRSRPVPRCSGSR